MSSLRNAYIANTSHRLQPIGKAHPVLWAISLKLDTSSAAQSHLRHVNFEPHKTFSSTAVLQDERRKRRPLSQASKPFKKPSSRPHRPQWEHATRLAMETEWSKKEQQIEDGMAGLVKHSQARLPEDPSAESRRERVAGRLAADLEVVQARRKLFDAAAAVRDKIRGGEVTFNKKDEKGIEGLFHPSKNAFAAEVRAWKLYTFAPVSEVGVMKRLAMCINILYKTLMYLPARILFAVLFKLNSITDSMESREGKR